MSALEDIAAERRRQIEVEGWTAEHDDKHVDGEMAGAAACYALQAAKHWMSGAATTARLWPWDTAWWKPTDARRNLVKAGALIVAEIERLDRSCVITDGPDKPAMSTAAKLSDAVATLRAIHWGCLGAPSDTARRALERIGVGIGEARD